MENTTIQQMLQHAIAYCDEQTSIARHDPEGVRDEERSDACQKAANILEALAKQL